MMISYYDKLLGTVREQTGIPSEQGDLFYLPSAGGSVSGDMEYPPSGFVYSDGTDTWRVQIDNSGVLLTTAI